MKNIIDFILESQGQRISKRADNRPYDPKDDKLLKQRDSRPERAKQLRETKIDKQVQEFCSALVNDFMVKFYKLTSNKSRLLSFGNRLTNVFNKLAKDKDIDSIIPTTERDADGCVFLHTNVYDNDSDTNHTDYILRYKSSDSFTNIIKKLDFYFKTYYVNGWGRKEISDDGNTNLYISFDNKFFASVLHRLRKHDLAEKVNQRSNQWSDCNLFNLFDDVADNYNKNYFADKFKEFETAYNDVLAKW